MLGNFQLLGGILGGAMALTQGPRAPGPQGPQMYNSLSLWIDDKLVERSGLINR